MQISAVIPAYNEAESIASVLKDIDRTLVKKIVVVDNGSTDSTGETAVKNGALVIQENRRGYGYACLAGIASVPDADIYVFLDGDYSDYPDEIPKLIEPIQNGESDLVIGSRVSGGAEKGSLSLPQRFGNALAVFLLNLIFKTGYTDLGPFRAIRSSSLKQLGMKDKKYGWTVEMQIKAAFFGLKISEVPVSYRKRLAGKSKVSGTVRGVFLAGMYILYYICAAFFISLFYRLRKQKLSGSEAG